jgi:hypothetical protein
MSLLALYLTALIIGGVLLAVSLVVGGEHGEHGDAGAGPHPDHDHGHGHDGHGAELLAWFPIASLRFWTFFLAGCGLVGTACTVLGVASSLSLPVAIAVGYVAGWGFVSVSRRLQRSSADSSLSEKDYIGATARVVLSVSRDRTGKVRLHLKGRTIELLADTDEEQPLGERQLVTVYALKENGNVMVTRGEGLAE